MTLDPKYQPLIDDFRSLGDSYKVEKDKRWDVAEAIRIWCADNGIEAKIRIESIGSWVVTDKVDGKYVDREIIPCWAVQLYNAKGGLKKTIWLNKLSVAYGKVRKQSARTDVNYVGLAEKFIPFFVELEQEMKKK